MTYRLSDLHAQGIPPLLDAIESPEQWAARRPYS